jgi:hypothetical protein
MNNGRSDYDNWNRHGMNEAREYDEEDESKRRRVMLQ